MNNHPHGSCTCPGVCACQHDPGPAAYEVTRGGRRIRVCTKCIGINDTDRRILATDTTMEPLIQYDESGARLVARLRQLARERPTG